ncbi:MLP-like protein 31 [Silene latifolia]|uniref:MLP-like protein 31 n=1 Tax=Silene latifolia TaxID=37657 RepID=UPI003D785EE8
MERILTPSYQLSGNDFSCEFSYLLEDGKKCVAKELIEVIDEENQLVRFKIIDGDLLKEFKSFTLTVHVLPRGELTGVKWISEFEKIDESVPYPTKLIDFCIAVTKDIETHHLNEAKTEAAKTE